MLFVIESYNEWAHQHQHQHIEEAIMDILSEYFGQYENYDLKMTLEIFMVKVKNGLVICLK